MARLITAQPKFKVLVANLEGASDPSRGPAGNPVKARTGFEVQNLPEVLRGSTTTRVQDPSTPGAHTHRGVLSYTASPVPVVSTGTLTVANNDFSADATIYLHDFVLVSGEEYTVGAGVNDTATNIAAAINALPGFTAAAVLAAVNITGPFGPNGNELRFEAVYRGSIQNFTFVPADGSLSSGEPTIGPPTIL